MGGGILGGRARKPVDPETVRVTFEDVAGIDEVEAEINEVVDFLRDPAKYRRLGARAPKGVLLTGAPGTGKTLLARATAGEVRSRSTTHRSRMPRLWWPVLTCRSVAEFHLSTEGRNRSAPWASPYSRRRVRRPPNMLAAW